jgi:hypothetical protein
MQENIRVGLIQRVQAAEGFKNSSDPVQRERYNVIISGVIQRIRSLSTMWSVLSLYTYLM